MKTSNLLSIRYLAKRRACEHILSYLIIDAHVILKVPLGGLPA
jgi:hypothetical protein